ncbi:DUF2184 domain-containing protein [Candidatus Clostridium helianthi]|uniref:DUF2184 domain-containing protein n=1 Tax=Candidatus Clostridium helianthi TaxID=3381660 RepID=A0ABW8SAC6_9CLOT
MDYNFNYAGQTYGQQLPLGGYAATVMDAASIGSGMAYLEGELEKKDPKLNEPLASVTFARDMPIRVGGGWVETTSHLFANYATSGGNNNGIIRGQSNDIPVVQADTSKDIFKTFAWSNILKVPFIDQQKMQGIGRSLDAILDTGIKLNYNKALDYICYKGVPELNVYGLVNNPDVTTSTVANNGAGTSTKWANKTAQEIQEDINILINTTWKNSEYDLTGMATHILVPPEQYNYLVNHVVSSAGNVSILTYLLENNLAKNQGLDLDIQPSRWCIGAGLSNTDRMVAYVNDESRILMDIPVPLTRAMTQPSVNDMAYLTGYVANLGQVKTLYYQCIEYADGI